MGPDAELQNMSRKFKLDHEAESKLSDVLAKYAVEERRAKMLELEKHLETSSRPSAMVMMSLKKLAEGLSLGRPAPPAPGCWVDKRKRGEVDDQGNDRRDRGRDRGGDRDRDKDKDRDRDRGRDRRPRDRSRDRDRDR